MNMGYALTKVIDRGVIEIVGPNGLTNDLTAYSSSLAKLDNSIVTTYALYFIISLIVLLFIVFAPLFLVNFDLNAVKLGFIYLAALVIVIRGH